MCTNPHTKDGNTFACRQCDECIAARRAGWVARCMAEKTQWQHAVCVTLTYDDKAPGGYDAARFFAYGDIGEFLDRIRAALRRINKTLSVRFICAGEQGDRNGRCHWHMILWSDYDLRRLGEKTRYGKEVSDVESLMSSGKKKKRFHWSLWARDKHPLGFVTWGAADQAGAHYVVSYCLKDQFQIAKAKGSPRETKAENFATGLFRMSKRPAIGEAWLRQQIERWRAEGVVLPNTNLKVPGCDTYWYPSGTMREKLLRGFRSIYEEQTALGRAVPQWAGLRGGCANNPKDLDILNGTETETLEEKERFQKRSNYLKRISDDWATDAEIERLPEARARAGRAATLRCLCEPCLTSTEGPPRYHQASQRFYAAGSLVEIASGETVHHLWGEKACCDRCGAKQGLWTVDEAGSHNQTKGRGDLQAAS